MSFFSGRTETNFGKRRPECLFSFVNLLLPSRLAERNRSGNTTCRCEFFLKTEKKKIQFLFSTISGYAVQRSGGLKRGKQGGGLPVVYLEQLNLIGALRRRLRDFHLCISISQDSLSRSSVLTAKEYFLFTELACNSPTPPLKSFYVVCLFPHFGVSVFFLFFVFCFFVFLSSGKGTMLENVKVSSNIILKDGQMRYDMQVV